MPGAQDLYSTVDQSANCTSSQEKDRRVISCDPYDRVYAEVPVCVKPCQMTRGIFLAGTGLILRQSCSAAEF